ncbi:MAG: hypothetical protein ACLUN9_29050 [Enterocloster aldenensis]|jgi:hypothetical protein
MSEKSCITINCGSCGNGGADVFPFKEMYKIEGVVGSLSDTATPYPDECNSENFLPISLMIRSENGIGYFNCAHDSVYIQTIKDGFVIADKSNYFTGRKCICLFGRI